MEWIKAKYDRLLLGFCGLVALIVGGLLLMNAVSWKKQFSSTTAGAGDRENFGTTDAGAVIDSALTRLKTVAQVTPPLFNGIPVSLFTSAPVMKVAGDPNPIPILDPNSKQIRPPVPNRWLYENNLDLRQVNILEVDTDNDRFSNLEEFTADPKTNPQDATSHPPVWVKIQFRELVQENFSLKFNAFTSPTEITFRVTPSNAADAYTTKFLGPGGKIQSTKGGEDRFVITKIDASVAGKEVAILDDLKTGAKNIAILFREEKNFPTNRAKLVCTLGKEEEKIVNKGDEFYFEVDPDQKYTVKEITPTEVVLEFTPNGATEKKEFRIKILPPP
jgi:hypothetical protein